MMLHSVVKSEMRAGTPAIGPRGRSADNTSRKDYRHHTCPYLSHVHPHRLFGNAAYESVNDRDGNRRTRGCKQLLLGAQGGKNG
jgi:hypothetical protein